jgi:hypothetical protein
VHGARSWDHPIWRACCQSVGLGENFAYSGREGRLAGKGADMFRRSTRANALGDDSSKPRMGRGLGPFSGGQLTTIIIAIVLAVALPVGAWAVSGTTVFVTDSVSGKTASVNARRQLNVAASGSVTATPTPPSASFDQFSVVAEDQMCEPVISTVPTGKALIVTSVTVDVRVGTTGPFAVYLYAATPGSPCGTVIADLDISEVPGAGHSEAIPFPEGLPIKAGHIVGVLLNGGSEDAQAYVNTKGYLVSSNMCTVSGPPTGCD